MKNRRKTMYEWLALLTAVFLLASQAYVPSQADTYTYVPYETDSDSGEVINIPFNNGQLDACRAGGTHNWVRDEESYVAPNCVEPGMAAYRCSKCGAWKDEEVPPTGVHTGEWITREAATCEHGGSEYRVCTVCGFQEVRETPAGNHQFGAWEMAAAPTCQREGVQVRVCSICGQTERQSLGMGTHSFGEWQTYRAATCTQEGILYQECAYCALREYQHVEKVPHDFGGWYTVTEATDFTRGTRQHVCSMCGLTEQLYFYPDGTLMSGDEGEDVLTLQNALNAAGFDCGTPDGDYGGKTKTAIAAFEREHDLRQDGIAWPGVQKLLYSGAGKEDEELIPVEIPGWEPVNPPVVDNPPKPVVDDPVDDPPKPVVDDPVIDRGEDSGNLPDNPPEGVAPEQEPGKNTDTSVSEGFTVVLTQNKSYPANNGKYYYAGEEVSVWVTLKNRTDSDLSNIVVYNAKTQEVMTYDSAVYPITIAGQPWGGGLVEGSKKGYMYYHVVTPEEAKAGSITYSFRAEAKDTAGKTVKTETVSIEIKTSGTYTPPWYETEKKDEEKPVKYYLTAELYESSQRMHEEGWRHYFYAEGEQIKYKMVLTNETKNVIYDVKVESVYNAKIVYETDEITPTSVHTTYFYITIPERDAKVRYMENRLKVTYTDYMGITRTIISEPCTVDIAVPSN